MSAMRKHVDFSGRIFKQRYTRDAMESTRFIHFACFAVSHHFVHCHLSLDGVHRVLSAPHGAITETVNLLSVDSNVFRETMGKLFTDRSDRLLLIYM